MAVPSPDAPTGPRVVDPSGEHNRRNSRRAGGGRGQAVMNQPATYTAARAGAGPDTRVAWRVWRVWEHLLGGFETFVADQDLAWQMEAVTSDVRRMVLANRAFTRRVVTHLLDAGVDQFLDVGCGMLSADSVHETLAACGSPARSVHVDIDAVAVERATAWIADSSRAHAAAAVRSDLREPSTVFDHPTVKRLLDFGRPVATIAAGVLTHLGDDPAAGLLTAVREASVDGSFLAVTHPTADIHAEVNALTMVGARPRSRAGVQALLNGWQLCEPGLVWAPDWRPDPDEGDASQGGRAARYLFAALAATTGGGR
jgi:S-adenosyl methyltransferase